jgi:pullulanase-type alpha-1,6-glucosidase
VRNRFAAGLLACALIMSILPPAALAQPVDGADGDGTATTTSAAGAPTWAKEASIYHVFVDRFADGGTSNNVDVDTTLDFSEALKDWMGGDLAGVLTELDHIEDLGFDTVWLGPVYEGKYFHGYHPISFTDIDENFGTMAELRALVDEVHDRGMRIVYDFVPNHTSDEHPWFQDALAECQDSDYVDFYKFNDDCTEWDTFFGIDELPELDLLSADSPASRYLLDTVVPFYLDDLGFDGFRIDHAKGPGSVTSEGTDDNQAFLAALRDDVDAMAGDKYLFGEIWSPRGAIAGYQDTLDGALNFPVHDAMISTLAGNASLAGLDTAVRADLDAYDDDFVLTSFLDNHDVQRFVFRAGNDAAARERLQLALTAQFALPGSPILYNGTEFGMGQTANTEAIDGGWVDRWYREPLPWTDRSWAHAGSDGFALQPRDQDVLDTVVALNELRDAQPALIHGDYETVAAAGDLLTFERRHGDDRLLTVINRGGDRTLALDELYGVAVPDGVTLTALLGEGTTTSSDGDLDVEVAGLSGEVFTVTGDLPAAPGPGTGPAPDVPDLVTLAGSFQSELGCTGDWQPDCEATALSYEPANDVWRGTFTIPAGTWEHKVAIDGSWALNYGRDAVVDGDNIRLVLSGETEVTFLFSHRTGWVANDQDQVFATVPGSFNGQVGCADDWQPDCFRTWMQDLDGDGTYTYISPGLQAGDYEFKVATFGSWDTPNYGVDGGSDNLVSTLEQGERLRVDFTPPVGDGNATIATQVLEPADDTPPPPPPPPTAGDREYAVVHYLRDAGDEDDWGLHLFGDIDDGALRDYGDPTPFVGETDYGRFAWFRLQPGASEVGFIVYDGATKDVEPDRSFDPNVTPEIWLRQGDETVYTSRAAAQGFAEIRYQRPDGDYGDAGSDDFNDFWGLHLWGDALAPGVGTDWPAPRKPDEIDDFGAVWRVPIDDADAELNVIVHRGDAKDTDRDRSFVPRQVPSAWLLSGDETIHASRAAALELAVIHYHRPDGDYGDATSDDFNDVWGLHTWTGALAPTDWPAPERPVRQDGFGVVFEVDLLDDATELHYLLHRGVTKDVDPDQNLDLTSVGHEIWLLSEREEPLLPMSAGTATANVNLRQQRGHFVTSGLISWPWATVEGATYRLHHAAEGGLAAVDGAIVGGDSAELQVVAGGLPTEVSERDGFFHLAGREALAVDLDDEVLDVWLTGQLAVSATATDGTLLAATGLQLPGVLDERFADEEAPLGPTYAGEVPSLGVWAPTAKTVSVQRFEDGADGEPTATVPMQRDGGVWSVTGDASWDRTYYLYAVEVYVPSLDEVVTNLVTDPYSLSLAPDSERSHLVDLSDASLAPEGWSAVSKPAFAGQKDLTVYELHVRDFSAADETVPEELRGTFAAFGLEDTDGVRHLGALAEAGLSHLHLLPINDIATIPEREQDQVVPVYPADTGPAATEPQAIQQATRDQQAFNWGYDPFHFTTPEGSYATDPMGETRIVEFRDAVRSINDLGLRVVVDVVYNHTNGAGQGETSVFDRIVPGYYQRLSDTGVIETSTCCPNTATEHAMMERLMIDSVLTWAKDYKVDGFRFDLMGHHPKAQMERLRAELDALTLEDDGVDGSAIVIYGEGWNFGEVADDARFVQATQANMAGTGIGTFNDRLRDAARGGNPFGGLQEQGFVTGLAVDPNGTNQGSAIDVEARARRLTDLVRLGMAGNLADITFETATGEVRAGRELDYNGSPAGYAGTPTDNVVYVSKHDNETLFDAIQYKLPRARELEQRARTQTVGLASVMFSQGTPFFHAGSDLLRSKSLDRDSYNSGDRWNAIDWSGKTSNWGVGLPNAEKNQDNWPLMSSLLEELPAPQVSEIDATADAFRELLAIRASSELFRLDSLEAVQEQLAFHATGPDAPLGVIAMSLSGGTDGIEDLLVVLNADVDDVTIDTVSIPEGDWQLHPVLADSADPVVRTASVDGGTFTVPARTAAVFVQLADDGGPGEPPVCAPGRPPGTGHSGPPPWAGVPGRPPFAGGPGGPSCGPVVAPPGVPWTPPGQGGIAPGKPDTRGPGRP